LIDQVALGRISPTTIILCASGMASLNENPQTPTPGRPDHDRPAVWVWITVIVAALGYFVDVADLWLFSNFRVASLSDLGVSGDGLTNTGAFLLNCQQTGLLLGGVVWGVLGDKRGRSSVMFGSILLYSVGNILNAFVSTVPQYAVLRFITGVGLAGEIGAGLTLVCEILPKEKRGIGTTFVTGLGVAGAILAALMGKYLTWRTAFFVGGLMGLSLLFLRVLTHDSGMFAKMSVEPGIRRGSLRLLLANRRTAIPFLGCIAAGMPIFLTFSVFAVFSPELAPAVGVTEPISVADVMLFVSVGLTIGDVLAGVLSQILRRRKLPLVILMILTCITAIVIVSGIVTSRMAYQILAGLLALFSGYWACLITTAAEQFGTNIRATATTMVPNLVRATTIPITTLFVYLKGYFSIQNTTWLLVVLVFSGAFWGVSRLRETFHDDLDYYER
jgi:putative MFS transporter